MKEKKARVEDAMHATKAAVEEGIVPGGGVALLRAIPALDKAAEGREDLPEDVRVGHRDRAPRDRGAAALDRDQRRPRGQRSSSPRCGELKDAEPASTPQTEKFENLVEAGVIDPTKVVRSAIQNAASIAALMLTTEADRRRDPGEEEGSSHAAPAEWTIWMELPSVPFRQLGRSGEARAVSRSRPLPHPPGPRFLNV